MAIPTSRTQEPAQISLYPERCKGCGLCVSVCKDFSLVMRDGKVAKSEKAVFGCIGCGHCMAICPEQAVEVHGRCLTPDDLLPLPHRSERADFALLKNLLLSRRSIREYRDKPVPQSLIDDILEATQTAPAGLPPSDVHVLVFNGKEKTRAFAADFSRYLKRMRYMSSDWFLSLMRPFWGKENDRLFRGFIKPLFRSYTDEFDKGNNYINYDAPLAMYFYGTPYSDPADPIVAATYAMLAGEAAGLGSCMLGAVHPFIQNGRKARKFRKKHGIRYKSREGLFVAFGFPRVKYQKTVKRSFAAVDYWKVPT